MSTGPSRHPNDQTLAEYRLGTLDAMFRDSVEDHLAACEECRLRAASPSAGPGSPTSGGFASSVVDRGETPPSAPGSIPPELAEHPDYRVIRELGRGGMGVVYLAENRLMGRKEVLKVVGAHLVRKKSVLDRFLREIRAAAQLRHPNIVAAHAASRLGEGLVLAMEYVEGYDLARLVESKGPLDVALACNFVHQAAMGLQHAHARGMVHRDVKPSNLMVTREGKRPVLKILDFGLAKVTSEAEVDGGLTREGQMLGTPHYVAPEQTTDAQKADIRADVYSLGCTLYCLLTGRPPFDAGSLYELLQAHHSKEPQPLSEIRPDVPPALAAVVAKMMAKSPDARHQTPGEVAADIAPFLKPARSSAVVDAATTTTEEPGRTESTNPEPESGDPSPGFGRRRWRVAAAVAASLLVVLVPAAWVAYRAASAPTEVPPKPPPQASASLPAPEVPTTDVAKSEAEDAEDESRAGADRGRGGPFAKKGPGARSASEPSAPESPRPLAPAADPEPSVVASKAKRSPPASESTAAAVAVEDRPEPPRADEGPVAWRRLLDDPSAYDGRVVEVAEVLAFTQSPLVRSASVPGGIGIRLRIKNGPAVSSGNGEIAGSAVRIRVDEATAANLERIMAEAQARPSTKDPFEVVARFRVDAPRGSATRAVTLASVEMLCAYNKLAIARGELDRAFRILVADPRGANAGFGDGPKWIERMGGARFVDKARKDLKEHLSNLAADQRWAESDALFGRVAAQAVQAVQRSQAAEDAARRRMMGLR